MKVLYLLIDLKHKELPIAVGDSVPDLARQIGVQPASILSAMSRKKRAGEPCKYIKVEYEENDFYETE